MTDFRKVNVDIPDEDEGDAILDLAPPSELSPQQLESMVTQRVNEVRSLLSRYLMRFNIILLLVEVYLMP
jgi:hypothetical protein